MRRTSDAGAGKGAAEEPEPEPGDAPPSSSSATTTTYDPRDYQPPHPDDRGGADGKATKKGAGGKAKPSTEGQGGRREGQGGHAPLRQLRRARRQDEVRALRCRALLQSRVPEGRWPSV